MSFVEIMTRNPVPFEISMIIKMSRPISDEEYQDEILSIFREIGYNDMGPALNFLYKEYSYYKYASYVFREYIRDVKKFYSLADDIDPDLRTRINWDYAMLRQHIKFKPLNISEEDYASYSMRLYMSLEHLLSLLSPFFYHRWEDLIIGEPNNFVAHYEPTFRVIDDQEHLYEVTAGSHLVYDYDLQERKLVDIKYLIASSHPGMFLSGASIIQSIISNATHTQGIMPIISPSETIINTGIWEYLADLQENPLREVLKGSEDIPYDDYNKIPKLNTHYSNLNDILLDILREYTRNTGTMKDRCSRLVWDHFKNHQDSSIPFNNHRDLNRLLDDSFGWTYGPDVN